MPPADERSGGEREARDRSPPLREGDALDLELAGGESLACRIVGFDGSDLVLLVDRGLTPSAARAAALGSRGFATFERDGQLHAQQGVWGRGASATRSPCASPTPSASATPGRTRERR